MRFWQVVYYAPVGTAIVAAAALVTAIVAWRTNLASFRASFRPLVRAVPLIDNDTKQFVDTSLLLKNYGKGPAFSVFLYEPSAVFANAQPIARVSVVEPLGSGQKEATRLGRVEMLLEARHRLQIGERYRLLYQDVEGKFHETVFTVPGAARFEVRFLGTKLKEEIPRSAHDLAAIVTPEVP